MLRDVVVIGDRVVTREEIFEKGLRAARAFRSLGVEDEQTIAILMRNDFAHFEASRGASTIGLYAVPLNWHNKTDEIAYVMGDAKPQAIVAHSDIILGVRDAIPRDVHVFLVPAEGKDAGDCEATQLALDTFAGARIWSDWLEGFEPWDQPPKPPRGAILYTSGTTGRPKAVRKPAMDSDKLKAFVEAQRLVYGIGPESRSLVMGPLYHAMPDAAARSAVNEAEIAVLQPKFDPEGMLAIIEKYRITHVALVPTVFVRLLKLPKEVREKYDVSSLKRVGHTGGPCPIEIKKAMIDWWGPVITEAYGGTEMGVAFYCRSDEWLQNPGTVGKLMPNARVAIMNDAGEVLAPGEVGEIFARNPDYGDFTYVGKDAQRREVERDGLITIGDVGYINERGYLFLCDRKRDMVISGGVNIYPAEIEAMLITHPDVRDCAVFGIPDDDLGESLVAAVQLRDGASVTADGIREFLTARLTNYKVPKTIEFHSYLPREDSGKIFKRKLRDPHWEGRSRAI